MRSSILVILSVLFGISVSRALPRSGGGIRDAFVNPASQYRPKFRYWLPDASVSRDVVVKDIEEIASIGGGGLEFLPFYFYGYVPSQGANAGKPPPTDWNKYGFGTPAFVSLLKDALQAVEKNGLVMDLSLGPNQGAGVPAIASTPGLAVELLMGNVTVAGGGQYSGPVPPPQPPLEALAGGLGFQQPLLDFGPKNITAVVAMKILSNEIRNVSLGGTALPLPVVALDETSFIDLTTSTYSGNVQWQAPEGNSSWRIISFWEAYTNQKECAGGVSPTNFIGNGSWIVDHFSENGAQVVTDFWDQYILNDNDVQNLVKSVGEYAWEDSIEMVASLFWTPDFLDRFQKNRGYSALPYLASFFNISNSWNGAIPTYTELYSYGNDSTLQDYRTTLNEGYQGYIAHFEQWTHSRGLRYSDQPAYNLPLEMLTDVPLLDAPEGESLGFQDNIDAYRQFSGPAHLASRNVISSELGAVNTPPYSQTIPNLLYHIRQSMAGGFTMHIIHGSPYSSDYPNTTWPGYTTFYYNYTDMWNSLQPCWTHMKDEFDYIGRNQYILQQGVPKVDLAVYLYRSAWEPETVYQSENLENLGYTYNYLGPNNLLSEAAAVTNGQIAVDGPAYQALIFSNQTILSTEAARKVLTFANAGLPVIFVGQPPSRGLSGREEDQQAFIAAMGDLLSATNVHRLDTADELPQTLSSLKINPRVSLDCFSNPVYPLQRSDPTNGVDYVYLFNSQNKSTTCNAQIKRTTSSVPFVYDTWKGTKTPLLAYTLQGDTLQMNFTLQSNETLLLGLHEPDNCPSSVPTCSISCISSPADVSFINYNASSSSISANLLAPVSFTTSSGATHAFKSIAPPPVTPLTSWNLTLDSYHPPADIFNVTNDITTYNFNNQALVPWYQLGNGLETVSGIGRYVTQVTIPSSDGNLGAVLSLGPIQHTVRARINNKPLDPIDPSNPNIDITSFIGQLNEGEEFELEIEVSSPLFNTVKANRHRIQIWGYTADHQPAYESMDYMRNGLLGPVEIKWGQVVKWTEDKC